MYIWIFHPEKPPRCVDSHDVDFYLDREGYYRQEAAAKAQKAKNLGASKQKGKK